MAGNRVSRRRFLGGAAALAAAYAGITGHYKDENTLKQANEALKAMRVP